MSESEGPFFLHHSMAEGQASPGETQRRSTHSKVTSQGQEQRYTLVIPTLGNLKQEDCCEFHASLGCRESS